MAVIRRLSTVVMIALLLFIALFPVLWTLLGSFKTLKDIVTPVPVIVFTPTLGNYVTVLATPAVQLGLMNSVIVVGGALGIGMLLGIPAAHALARHVVRFKADALVLRPVAAFHAAGGDRDPLHRALPEARHQRHAVFADPHLLPDHDLDDHLAGRPGFRTSAARDRGSGRARGLFRFRGFLARVAAGRASVARRARSCSLSSSPGTSFSSPWPSRRRTSRCRSWPRASRRSAWRCRGASSTPPPSCSPFRRSCSSA